MARTLIVTDPLTLLAPPGPQTARQLQVEGDLLMVESASENTLRLSTDNTSAQGGVLVVRAAKDPALLGETVNFIRL